MEMTENTAFVGNLPVKTKKKALKKLFAECGSISSVRFRSVPVTKDISKKQAIISNLINKESDCINAYIKFDTAEGLSKAITLNNTSFHGHTIRVTAAAEPPSADPKSSVVVGNIPYKIKDDEIREHFADCGEIKAVYVIRDKSSGLCTGVAFVDFEDGYSVPLALAKHESQINGRQIRVTEFSKKVQSEVNAAKAAKLNNPGGKVELPKKKPLPKSPTRPSPVKPAPKNPTSGGGAETPKTSGNPKKLHVILSRNPATFKKIVVHREPKKKAPKPPPPPPPSQTEAEAETAAALEETPKPAPRPRYSASQPPRPRMPPPPSRYKTGAIISASQPSAHIRFPSSSSPSASPKSPMTTNQRNTAPTRTAPSHQRFSPNTIAIKPTTTTPSGSQNTPSHQRFPSASPARQTAAITTKANAAHVRF